MTRNRRQHRMIRFGVASMMGPLALAMSVATLPAAGAQARPASGAAGGVGAECESPSGTDTGVTDDQIKVAVILNNYGAAESGKEAVDLPGVSDQRDAYQAVIDDVNAAGGIACRQVVPDYFPANPVELADMRATCLGIDDADVFAVLDRGAYSGLLQLANCYPEHEIPYMGTALFPHPQTDKNYPYLMSSWGSSDDTFANMVFALKERGFFDKDKGFKKLGVLYRDCNPAGFKTFQKNLKDAGVSGDDLTTFNLGKDCGSFGDPATLQQAVLNFQDEGVSHVSVFSAEGDWAAFTEAAEQQDYRPKYGLSNHFGVINLTAGTPPNADNAAGTIVISQDRGGENTTPNFELTEATKTCDEIMTANGLPTVYEQPFGTGGTACNQVWMLKAAAENAPSLKKAQLAEGLHAAKSVDFSFPDGPNDFSGERVTTGGQQWRTVKYVKRCQCWQVVDPEFQEGASSSG